MALLPLPVTGQAVCSEGSSVLHRGEYEEHQPCEGSLPTWLQIRPQRKARDSKSERFQ